MNPVHERGSAGVEALRTRGGENMPTATKRRPTARKSTKRASSKRTTTRRANDPITILRKDHREAEELIQRLEDSKSPGTRRRQTVDQLVAALTLHMDLEERLLYPLARKELGAEEAKEAMVEHQLARDGLKKLKQLVDAPGFGAAVDMVKGGIKHHVKDEETEMFPKLKKKVDRTTLLAIGDQIAAAKRSRG
jgi:iron-sulfur cluster repair protein YtfE (RIC family)